ncbi:MAG: 16S rRNA (cytosine(967)-C(5))-methyltransferase RsmB [Oscillospiraceae bacterium]|nr:16S rRNA (cytosine(967)-C(5))-methyltransferase RsmB [Oscillospiraceae bacterium]
MSARETALNVLIACRKQDGWSNGVLKDYIVRDQLDRRDAALASRLCYGVLQNRGRLDFYLKQLLTGRVKDLHPAVRDILHLGLYQIYEMDKIPASAAVNESVAMAKKYCKKQRFAPGLVNAVLRSAVRTKGTLDEPGTLEDRYSHPKALIDLLRKDIGEERLEAMLAANNAQPATAVQVNTLRTTAEALMESLARQDVEARPHLWMPDCLVLSGTGNLEKLSAFQEGLFYVQDPAAKLSVLCARIPRGAKVLDCCAAPGGKSFAAAIAMEGRGGILSCDIHTHKTVLIQNGSRRLGLENVMAKQQDATVMNPQWRETMDVVLADVPCSGYGIIRKKPDIRYKDPASMAELPALQLRILQNQAEYVKPGGTLLYSTCTLLRRENEDVVKAFLRQRTDFYLEPLELPENFPENTDGMLTLVPGEYDTDGFFIARLRRKSCARI